MQRSSHNRTHLSKGLIFAKLWPVYRVLGGVLIYTNNCITSAYGTDQLIIITVCNTSAGDRKFQFYFSSKVIYECSCFPFFCFCSSFSCGCFLRCSLCYCCFQLLWSPAWKQNQSNQLLRSLRLLRSLPAISCCFSFLCLLSVCYPVCFPFTVFIY